GSARYGPTDRSTSPSVHSKQQQWTRLCCLSREGPVGREGGGRRASILCLWVESEKVEERRESGVHLARENEREVGLGHAVE
ncbi:unnamed protein product, partial [Musa hybrid cultivar]